MKRLISFFPILLAFLWAQSQNLSQFQVEHAWNNTTVTAPNTNTLTFADMEVSLIPSPVDAFEMQQITVNVIGGIGFDNTNLAGMTIELDGGTLPLKQVVDVSNTWSAYALVFQDTHSVTININDLNTQGLVDNAMLTLEIIISGQGYSFNWPMADTSYVTVDVHYLPVSVESFTVTDKNWEQATIGIAVNSGTYPGFEFGAYLDTHNPANQLATTWMTASDTVWVTATGLDPSETYNILGCIDSTLESSIPICAMGTFTTDPLPAAPTLNTDWCVTTANANNVSIEGYVETFMETEVQLLQGSVKDEVGIISSTQTVYDTGQVTFTITGLTADTTNWYKVIVIGPGGTNTSNTWAYTTGQGLPIDIPSTSIPTFDQPTNESGTLIYSVEVNASTVESRIVYRSTSESNDITGEWMTGAGTFEIPIVVAPGEEYTAKVEARNCISATSVFSQEVTFTAQLISGIGEIANSSIEIHTNPGTKMINLNLTESCEIMLVNLLGQETKRIQLSEGKHQIPYEESGIHGYMLFTEGKVSQSGKLFLR